MGNLLNKEGMAAGTTADPCWEALGKLAVSPAFTMEKQDEIYNLGCEASMGLGHIKRNLERGRVPKPKMKKEEARFERTMDYLERLIKLLCSSPGAPDASVVFGEYLGLDGWRGLSYGELIGRMDADGAIRQAGGAEKAIDMMLDYMHQCANRHTPVGRAKKEIL